MSGGKLIPLINYAYQLNALSKNFFLLNNLPNKIEKIQIVLISSAYRGYEGK